SKRWRSTSLLNFSSRYFSTCSRLTMAFLTPCLIGSKVSWLAKCRTSSTDCSRDLASSGVSRCGVAGFLLLLFGTSDFGPSPVGAAPGFDGSSGTTGSGFCAFVDGGSGVGEGAAVCGLCAVASKERDKKKLSNVLRNEFI